MSAEPSSQATTASQLVDPAPSSAYPPSTRDLLNIEFNKAYAAALAAKRIVVKPVEDVGDAVFKGATLDLLTALVNSKILCVVRSLADSSKIG